MSPYRLKHNESESNIKNYNFLYKNTKKAKTLSKKRKNGKFQKSKISKNPICYFAFSTRSTIHIFIYFFRRRRTTDDGRRTTTDDDDDDDDDDGRRRTTTDDDGRRRTTTEKCPKIFLNHVTI